MKSLLSFLLIALSGIFLRVYAPKLILTEPPVWQILIILSLLLIGGVIKLFQKTKDEDYPPVWRVALVSFLTMATFYWITYFLE